MVAFQVNIDLDPTRFEAALDDLSKKVREETGRGAVDAAEYIKNQVQELLSRYPHSKKESSPTPPFKGPPGYISGDLHDSVEVRPGLFQGSAKVFPSAPYARIQEFGGFCGTRHLTYVPPRPYFRPVVMSMGSAVGVQHIFYEHWRTAMLEAVAFLKT